MQGRGDEPGTERPKGQDFNEHVAYFLRSVAAICNPWFWPVLAEVYEQSRPVLRGEIELHLESGSELEPNLTVPELSRALAELAENNGGITHRHRSTVRESGGAPASEAVLHTAWRAWLYDSCLDVSLAQQRTQQAKHRQLAGTCGLSGTRSYSDAKECRHHGIPVPHHVHERIGAGGY
eukprot:5895447-Pleurochrysis_carterae.AAC.2